MQNITDVETYTDPIQCPADGDDANGANTKVGFQGLSNRTKTLRGWHVLQDTYNEDLRSALNNHRTYMTTLSAIGRNCASFNLNDAANSSLTPGDDLVLQADSGSEVFASAYLGDDEDTLDFDSGDTTAGVYEFTIHLRVQTYGGFTDPIRVGVDLVLNGVVARKWWGVLETDEGDHDVVISGSAIMDIVLNDVVSWRFSSDNGGNCNRVTNSRVTVKQLTSDAVAAAPTALPSTPALPED